MVSFGSCMDSSCLFCLCTRYFFFMDVVVFMLHICWLIKLKTLLCIKVFIETSMNSIWCIFSCLIFSSPSQIGGSYPMNLPTFIPLLKDRDFINPWKEYLAIIHSQVITTYTCKLLRCNKGWSTRSGDPLSIYVYSPLNGRMYTTHLKQKRAITMIIIKMPYIHLFYLKRLALFLFNLFYVPYYVLSSFICLFPTGEVLGESNIPPPSTLKTPNLSLSI